MTAKKDGEIVKVPLKYKLVLISLVIIIPMILLSVYQSLILIRFTDAYDQNIRNITAANDYNLNFKEEMDESMYKLVVSSITFDTIDEKEGLTNPYTLIEDARAGFTSLYDTAEGESRSWLERLLTNLDLLEKNVDKIRDSIQEGGNYDENIYMLESNIYQLTDLLQEEIQYYIYYESANMESVRQELDDQVRGSITIGILALILVSAVAIGLNLWVTHSVTKPVRQLAGVADQVAKGNFSVRAGCSTRDEIQLLAGSFNHMTEDLESLVTRIQEEQQNLKNMELKLLQAQINPHFLYNTLDTIVWLIEGGKNQEAMDMVMALSEFFRILLSKGRDFISIREEERHIRSYLEIQQFRYGDILEYEIRIDPVIYDCRILKMTLQPLVENSIYHGIKPKRGKGKILVEALRQGDRICLSVSDDGVGMTGEELERVRKGLYKVEDQNDGGFGIANVFERIRLNYGDSYGLRVDSAVGKGTKVSIEIPVQEIRRSEVI